MLISHPIRNLEKEGGSIMNETVKDSGSKQEFNTGAHRDNPIGKGRCDLLPLKYVAKVMYNDPVITEINLFMETRDTEHLITAIRNSIQTLPQFMWSEIFHELKEDGITQNGPICRNVSAEESKTIFDTACFAHMMLEASKLYEAGANKYGENNWKLGMPVNRYIDSGVRHYLKTLRGDDDEPHYRGFVWNLLCAAWTAENKPEFNCP